VTLPSYQALATLADFLRLGLPGDALRLARTTQAPVQATGAGVGRVVPGGTLDVGGLSATELPVLVEVVAGGALGTATWRWSHDSGTTWTATATTPAAGVTAALTHPSLGIPTGLTVRFVGTQTASARFEWTATSVVAECLRAANEEAFGYLADRFGWPLDVVPTDIVRDVVAMAAADVAANVGYRPGVENDRLLEDRAAAARKRLTSRQTHDQGARASGPRTSAMAPLIFSRNARR
jgi:hypothetical protein